MQIAREKRLTWTLGLAALAACAGWALWPLPVRKSAEEGSVRETTSTTSGSVIDMDPFQRRVFGSVVLWNPLEREKSQARQSLARDADEKPLRLQLIGITQEDGVFLAALYDQDANRLLILKHGDQVRGERVSDITRTYVKLSDGAGERELRLKADKR